MTCISVQLPEGLPADQENQEQYLKNRNHPCESWIQQHKGNYLMLISISTVFQMVLFLLQSNSYHHFHQVRIRFSDILKLRMHSAFQKFHNAGAHQGIRLVTENELRTQYAILSNFHGTQNIFCNALILDKQIKLFFLTVSLKTRCKNEILFDTIKEMLKSKVSQH